MSKRNDKLWDGKADKALKDKPPWWLSYYLGNSYRKITKMALSYQDDKRRNLLKTDLWNEGVRTDRDILGAYQEEEKLLLYGIDISRTTCLQAKRRLKRLNVLQGSIRNLPFKDSCFDIKEAGIHV